MPLSAAPSTERGPATVHFVGYLVDLDVTAVDVADASLTIGEQTSMRQLDELDDGNRPVHLGGFRSIVRKGREDAVCEC